MWLIIDTVIEHQSKLIDGGPLRINSNEIQMIQRVNTDGAYAGIIALTMRGRRSPAILARCADLEVLDRLLDAQVLPGVPSVV